MVIRVGDLAHQRVVDGRPERKPLASSVCRAERLAVLAGIRLADTLVPADIA